MTTLQQTLGHEGPETSWSLLKRAAGPDDAAKSALSEFALRYYTAVRAFIRVIVRDPDLAQDLTQEFFQKRVLHDHGVLASADRAEGRFRPYLKRAIRNFLIDKHRQAARSPQPDLRFAAMPELWDTLQDDDLEAADEALLREWGQSIVHLAIERVRHIAESRNQHEHFAMFARRYLGDHDRQPRFREVGGMFDLDEKTARGRVQTIVGQFRLQLQELLRSDAGVDADLDQEIRNLIALL